MSLPLKFQRLFPERPRREPQPRVVAKHAFPHGERWVIEYAPSEGPRVRAHLLVPARADRPLPGIIASHQHNGQYHLGKSEPAGLLGDPALAYGSDLCARGYAVFCPDHAGFEDRRQKSRRGQSVLEGKAYEQFLFGDAVLRGGSLAAVYLFDLQQALDVLQEFRFVDSKRLGVIGHSLGGQTALWLAAADPRIRAGFSSCGFSTMDAVQRGNHPHNCACYVPGLLACGDLDEVAASIAPRAFGMSNGMADVTFPYSGVRRIHGRTRTAFPDGHLLAVSFRGGHLFPHPVRLRAYQFLDHHMKTTP